MAHALLSPSSASQWLTCTPSPRLGEHIKDSSSEFADEGTLAHAYAEVFLKHHDDKKMLVKELNNLKKHPFHEKHYSPELEEHGSNFADYVLEQCRGDYALEVEQKLDLRTWIPGGFGTGDAIVVKDQVLNLNDLKYGRGVKVSAVSNKQLMIYALGCIEKYGWIYDFHTVRLHIYQPRLNNISVWSITVEELEAWAESELREKAQMAHEGKGDLVPGEHCRFCKVKAECRALAKFTQDAVIRDFQDEIKEPHLLTPEEIGEVLGKIATVEIFLKAVKDHAYGTILGGGSIPGYKLVTGKPSRVYNDPDAVKAKLLELGYKKEDITTPPKEPTLLTLTALEKVLKKKKFNEIVGPFLGTKVGNPALAPVTDPRDEYVHVDNVFGDDLENDWLSD